MLYSCVVGHVEQLAAPASEYCPAPQLKQEVSAVVEQLDEGKEPAAHCVQAAQGVWPVALHVPAAHADIGMQERDGTSQ